LEHPPPAAGLCHVALYTRDLAAAERFYVGLLGMRVEWRPDESNVYLTSGSDNLALHRASEGFDPAADQLLDHVGLILSSPDDVDTWYEFLRAHAVEMKSTPRNHRDGARSFYCVGPDNVIVQMIYHPTIAHR
jgi:catechol 2,3-dioxygenase-like lactoylglutathione lyase family enzyme